MMMQSEITREEALLALLMNEKYSDITLKGTDGSLIKANRAMLAARSPVFDSMLYGDFAEASQSVVGVGYTGDVLKMLSLMDGASYTLPSLSSVARLEQWLLVR
jgi:hypothetical protein